MSIIYGSFYIALSWAFSQPQEESDVKPILDLTNDALEALVTRWTAESGVRWVGKILGPEMVPQ